MRLFSLTLSVQRTDLSEGTTVADRSQADYLAASSQLDRATWISEKPKFFYLLPERKILLIGCCLSKILPPSKKAIAPRLNRLFDGKMVERSTLLTIEIQFCDREEIPEVFRIES